MWKWIVMSACLLQAERLAAQEFQVVISELMGDPLPSVLLPPEEYIELTNLGAELVDLSGWELSNGRTTAVFPSGSMLRSGQQLILCAMRAVDSFRVYGQVIGLSRFPAISNTGDTIYLYNTERKLVHAAAYLPALLTEEKADGGWSLELVLPHKACRVSGNWKTSTSIAGGTPGKPNAVSGDAFDPLPFDFLHAYTSADTVVHLVFSDAVDRENAMRAGSIQIAENQSIKNIRVPEPFYNELVLELKDPLIAGQLYKVSAPGIRSCLTEEEEFHRGIALPVGLPADSATGVVINEVLFDPPVGGADYVELFHTGNQVVDLGRLQLANRNRSGAIDAIRPLNKRPRFIYPGDYLLLSTRLNWIRQHFPITNNCTKQEMAAMPSYPNDAGTVVLLEENAHVLDEFSYHDDLHHPMLRNKDAIALERKNPLAPSSDPANWTSAAAEYRYGTPGFQNSQFSRPIDRNRFFLEEQIFSPDGDGQNDFCKIQYELETAGYLCSIRIFNRVGGLERVLVNNAICGQKGVFTWNGQTENGQKLPVGLYILVIDCWDVSGKTKRYRLAVTLAMK